MNQPYELLLEGCTPVPLAGYLKALGVLRLLGDQKPEWRVRGAWRAERFMLRSPAFSGDRQQDERMIQAFFLDEYRPTPIVAPWNGGSGFYFQEGKRGERDPVTGKKLKTGVRDQPTEATKTVEIIRSSKATRMSEYRLVIDLAKSVVSELGYQEAPKEESKRALLQKLRGLLPERALVALDAGLVIGPDKPGYAPLLGTGWNDGNFDFTNNFMQRLVELVSPEDGSATSVARVWLPSALFGVAAPSLSSAAIGQFYPGGAGGPNASTGFDADSLMNPWDFVLMLEGALLFAAAASRRLEVVEPGMLAYPFTVRPSGSGNGAIGAGDEGQARAEMWLPLWSGFCAAPEIKSLLAEGRATLDRRPPRDGLGFVRAIASLGVDRGISAFQRYGFLMRSGKAFLATPLTRVEVRGNPDADLIEELDSVQFLERLRRFARDEQTPARVRSQVHQLEDALFDFAQRSEPRAVQKVLVALGASFASLAKSRKGQDAVPVLPSLSEAWTLKADDGSAEFRIATALAGIYGGGMPMRPFVIPVKVDKSGWVWDRESRLAVWGEGDFAANVAHVIARRRLEAEQLESALSLFQSAVGVTSGDVSAWLAGQVDASRLSGLFLGLVSARIPENFVHRGGVAALPAAYCVLKPFFTPPTTLAKLNLVKLERAKPLPGELIARLRAGHVQEAVEWAWRRLRAIGYPLPSHPREAPLATNLDGGRLLVALAMPLEATELHHCLTAITEKRIVETA